MFALASPAALLSLLCAALSWALLFRGHKSPNYSVRYAYLRAYAAVFWLYDGFWDFLCRRRRRSYHWFDDPSFVSENRLDTHAPLRVLPSVDGALFGPGGEFLFRSSALPTVLERYAHLDRAASEHTLLLDGDDWAFRLSASLPGPGPASASVPAGARPTLADPAAWGRITVPGNWQTQGYGQQVYTNVAYPALAHYHFKRPIVPFDSTAAVDVETGTYRKAFALPASWDQPGERFVTLLLHAAGPACRVFVNGVYVGSCKDSMVGSEFDLSVASDTLVFGDGAAKNVLAVEVVRWADAHFMEDQDQWWFSGLHRSVELQSRPYVTLQELRATPEVHLGAGAALGRPPAVLRVGVHFWIKRALLQDVRLNYGDFYTIRTVLYDPDGRAVYDEDEEVIIEPTGPAAAGEWADAPFRFARSAGNVGRPPASGSISYATAVALESVEPWSAERPALYTLGVELVRTFDGTVLQGEVARVGFRDVRVDRGRLCVNGAPIVVCGANRHEHSPRGGKTVAAEETWTDLVTMKRNNFNAVRCCHYPNAFHLYDLASELGLYVCDEANIETHGFTQSSAFSLLATLPRWRAMFLQRVQNMARRTVNFPCVVLHSLGNESGTGPNFDACSAWVRGYDPTRPVQYEGGGRGGDCPLVLGDGQGAESLTDIICPMYSSAKDIEAVVVRHSKGVDKRPLVLCEYAHAMGNSNGGLDRYWELFWRTDGEYRRLQGGFVWDWIDQGLARGGGRADGYGGDFGPKSGVHDAQFCINGVCLPDRTAKPAMEAFKHLQARVKFGLAAPGPGFASGGMSCTVLNRHDHVGLDGVAFEWAVAAGNGEYVARGTAALADPGVGPGEATRLEVPFDPTQSERCVRGGCQLHLWAVVGAAGGGQDGWRAEPLAIAHEVFRVLEGEAGPMDPSATSFVPIHSWGEVLDEGELVVDGPGEVEVGFDVRTGECRRISWDGVGGAIGGIAPCFYRAPTDNDRGGLDTMGAMVLPKAVSDLGLVDAMVENVVGQDQLSFRHDWLSVGLDKVRSEWEGDEDEGDENAPPHPGHHTSRFSHYGTHRGKEVLLFTSRTRYTLCAGGAVVVDVRVECSDWLARHRSLVRSLPRVGTEILVKASSVDRVVWKGYGPHECYPDRQAGAWYGVHSKRVEEMHTKYVVPGENGARVGCDSVTVGKGAGEEGFKGFTVTYRERGGGGEEGEGGNRATGGATISISPYSVEELVAARHEDELPRVGGGGFYRLHIDHSMMGLGGDNSWSPNTLEEYHVPVVGEGGERGVWEWSLFIEPVG
jgi:beta-galactosidase